MDHDQRDRRDSPDADDASTSPPDSTQPAPSDQPVDGSELPEASSETPAPDETSTWEAPDAAAPEPEAIDAVPDETSTWEAPPAAASEPESQPEQVDASSEPEQWPSRDSSSADASWPTEPPAAGSADADTWPTSAPERGDEPVREPEWSDATPSAVPADQAEPPPPEVEAYPAAEQSAVERSDAAAGAAMAAHSVPAAESATGESTLCPRCGTENRPGLAFCQNCGANLRGTAAGYVPPQVATEAVAEPVEAQRAGAVLGPVVLLIGLAGIITGYLLPFLYGSGSLYDRAFGGDGYGVSFWSAYPEVGAQLADQAYFGLTAAIPLLGLLLLVLAIAGFARATPGPLQTAGLGIALLWSVGIIVLFLVVELAGNWDGDLVGMLRVLTPAGIIFVLSALIILIGTLTRFGRS